MSEYVFFVSHLRFIVSKTDTTTPEVSTMMSELARIADAIEAMGGFTVEPDRLRVAGRGLAGLAGFLQERILPEAVAAGNATGERQVRWVIDTSMALMATLMTAAETGNSGEPMTVTLPPPP